MSQGHDEKFTEEAENLVINTIPRWRSLDDDDTSTIWLEPEVIS
jgi:hypothetical protein